MNKKNLVYRVINLINGKTVYIGFTSQKLYVKWNSHKRSTTLFGREIRRVGAKCFVIEAIFCGFDKLDTVKFWEPFFISQYNTKKPNGFNSTDGGEYPNFKDKPRTFSHTGKISEGERYGKLTRVGKEGNNYYILRCDCGKFVKRSPQSLSRSIARKYIPSCGCMVTFANSIYVGSKSQAVKTETKFTLSEKQFVEILNRNCYYCNSTATTVGCLNARRGYVIENSIPMCSHCLSAKGDTNHEEYVQWLGRILKFVRYKDFGLDKVIPI